MSEVATSKRLGLDRYLLSLNWFSSSSSCWLVKAVRGLRHFPIRPDWGPAGGGTTKTSVCGFKSKSCIFSDDDFFVIWYQPTHPHWLMSECIFFFVLTIPLKLILKYLRFREDSRQYLASNCQWRLIYLIPRTYEFSVILWVGQTHICPHSVAIINYNSFTPIYCWWGERQKRRRGHKNTGMPLT